MTKTELIVVEKVLAQCDHWFDGATDVVTGKVRRSPAVKQEALKFRDEVADVTRALRGLDAK